ncbi:hypothetical protein KQX54_012147 [Cotesia glomerata]|uniref:Uncharacterized protein n=1 Tax=Cotesia glomerata TaxID=32391 RepID=A0AAV7ILV6_COTGL|nr:hypothetical protein KQX54_012147 [Cotesia glomerata]
MAKVLLAILALTLLIGIVTCDNKKSVKPRSVGAARLPLGAECDNSQQCEDGYCEHVRVGRNIKSKCNHHYLKPYRED